jgi:methyl-accepting chemotaxis protein
MTTIDILQIVTYIIGILVVLLGVISWVARAFLRKEIADIRKNELSELKPNGGSSIKDSINQIQKDIGWLRVDITEVKENLAELRGSFNQHVKESAD